MNGMLLIKVCWRSLYWLAYTSLSAESDIQVVIALQRTSDLDPIFSPKPVFSARSERYSQVSYLDGFITCRPTLSQQHKTLVTIGVLCLSRWTLARHLGEVSIRPSYGARGEIVSHLHDEFYVWRKTVINVCIFAMQITLSPDPLWWRVVKIGPWPVTKLRVY